MSKKAQAGRQGTRAKVGTVEGVKSGGDLGTKVGGTKGRRHGDEPPKAGMIRARVDEALKTRAEEILSKLGLRPSDAIRLFYAQVTLREGLPFDVKLPNAATIEALRDAEAGKDLTRYEDVDEMFRDLGI